MHKVTSSMEWKLQNAPEAWELHGTPVPNDMPNGTNPSDEDKLVGATINTRSDKLIGMGITGRTDGMHPKPTGIGAPNDSKGFQYVNIENSKGFNDYKSPLGDQGSQDVRNSKTFKIGGLEDSTDFGAPFKKTKVAGVTGVGGTPEERDSKSSHQLGENGGRRPDQKTFSTTGKSVLNLNSPQVDGNDNPGGF